MYCGWHDPRPGCSPTTYVESFQLSPASALDCARAGGLEVEFRLSNFKIKQTPASASIKESNITKISSAPPKKQYVVRKPQIM
jgi:hypothetical protein